MKLFSHVISGSAVVILISYGHKSGRIKVADSTFILEMKMRKTNMNMILMSRLAIPPHQENPITRSSSFCLALISIDMLQLMFYLNCMWFVSI